MSDLKVPYESLALVNKSMLPEMTIAFNRVASKGWYILGSEVLDFEKDFANYLGVKYSIGVASGLDALILALKSLQLPLGSEVIVPSNTYIATILAILNEGLKPVLVEPDIKTYNIDPIKIVSAITPKTKAIMVVHLYGKSCEMDKIVEIAAKHGLPIIEDCAQSHGAKFRNQLTGSFGLGAFSFYPTKNLGALGDGGAVVTSDPDVRDKIQMLRNYGSRLKYYNEIIGTNSRLDELQAAFLNIKLKSLDQINYHKRELAQIYFDELLSESEIVLPFVSDETYDVYHIFNIRTNRRDSLRAYLLKKGIGTEVHYPVSPHRQRALIGLFDESSFPISDEIHATTLSLPISFAHSRENILFVAKTVKEFFKE